MFSFIILLFYILLISSNIYCSSLLNIWPYPAHVLNGNGDKPAISTNLGISCTCLDSPLKPRNTISRGSSDCSACTDTVTPAINRALERMFYIPFNIRTDKNSSNVTQVWTIRAISVTLNSPTDLQFQIDETYSLNIETETVEINSKNEWGAVWALETLIGLSYYNFTHQVYQLNCSLPLSIYDHPRVPWRGVLIDTARHYLKMSSLKNIVEGLSATKMNSLHLHLFDDQSFPLCLDRFPELCQEGAYMNIFGQAANYSKSSMVDFVNFAKSRGVRVIPELDFPGHTAIIAKVYPQFYVTCARGMPLPNPTTDDFYNFLGSLVEDLAEIFTDRYYHMGGDEVKTTCWSENKTVSDWLQVNNITATEALEQFHLRVQKILLSRNKYSIYWDEFWYLNASIRLNTTIAEIRKNTTFYYDEKIPLVSTGYNSTWYLDHGISNPKFVQQAWELYYRHDPFPKNVSLLPYALGGEADLWGEGVDDTNVIPRLFPVSSAIAEVLWSPASMVKSVYLAENRLNSHRCFLSRRGIFSAPIFPGPPCYSLSD